mgnify:CR=1 FL=1
MTQFDEALASRDEKYEGWPEAKLACDARMDMMRLLNVFTDIVSPSMADVQVMGVLADAVGKLKGAGAPWAERFPDVAKLKAHLDTALDAFLNAKAAGTDAADLVPAVFAAHRSLANAVMRITATEAERQAIADAVKK